MTGTKELVYGLYAVEVIVGECFMDVFPNMAIELELVLARTRNKNVYA